MTPISSLTLTSLLAQTLTVGMIDENNGNAQILGSFSSLSFSSADSTQDTAVANASVTNGVDIDAVSSTGGTTITANGTFASTKTNPDGTPVVSGTFSAVLTVTNNVVVKAVMTFLQ